MFTSRKNILTAILFSLVILSQPKQAHSQILVDLYGQRTFPQMQFREKGFNSGLGFGFGIMSNPLNGRNIETPPFVQIHAGGNMAFTGFGTKKYKLELAEPQSGMADVKISNIDFILTPTVRVVFGHGRVQPYVDGFAGFHFLSASQTVKPLKQSFNTSYEEETQTNLANTATYFAGLSTGVLFKLSESVYLNAGVSYGWGGNGNILPLKNIEQNGNELNYNFTNTRTDMLLVKFGFTFKAERDNEDNDTRSIFDHSLDYHHDNTPNHPRGKSNELKKNPQPKVGH